MCCECGGGFTWDLGSFDEEWDASAPYCYDDTGNGQLSSLGTFCDIFSLFGDVGSLFDTPTFTSSDLCCACGGGDTRICENTDDGSTDTDGYSCVDVAIALNHGLSTCGSAYDTPNFTATSMCCACGGGRTVTSSSEICQHSHSTVDTEGDTCTHYLKYNFGTGCDGTYDDDDFTASEMCCGCHNGTGPTVMSCVDLDFEKRDTRGKSCTSEDYDSGSCGLYDDEDFTANQMCCDCGGGFSWGLESLDEEWDASAPYCYDDTGNGELDSTGDTCGSFLNSDVSYCSTFDDSDFTASEMCCTSMSHFSHLLTNEKLQTPNRFLRRRRDENL